MGVIVFSVLRLRAAAIAAFTLLSGLPGLAHADGTPVDWAKRLKDDVQAFHTHVVNSHPGFHDPKNPAFRAQVEASFDQAMARARTAHNQGGWWWTLKGFAASFNDGHVEIDAVEKDFALPARWPGFLTRFEGDDQIVAMIEGKGADIPSLGAKLGSCDGTDAKTLAQSRVGAFEGLWFLEAQRINSGPQLFMDLGNPWIDPLKSCRFETETGTVDIDLDWKAIDHSDLRDRGHKLMGLIKPPIGLRKLGNGAFWLSMSTFTSDIKRPEFEQLKKLVADAKAVQNDMRTAPFVVLDVRGNGGGNSEWSEKLGKILWGEDWLKAHPVEGGTIADWRASKGNRAYLEKAQRELEKAGKDASTLAFLKRITDGMAKAEADGNPYWREEESVPPKPAQAHNEAAGTAIYALTDFRCASSCLTAVDTWKALGAIQVGRPTFADSFYMEGRRAELPGGKALLHFPMKVYRNRARGSDQPEMPVHLFSGNMTDDAALEKWIASLKSGNPAGN